MIKLDLLNCCCEGNILLSFELKIETSSSIESMEIFFNLETNKNYSIKIPAILSSENEETIEVRIPEELLSSVLTTSEEYSFTLEVLIDDRLFIPLQDTLIFVSPPKMTASCKMNSSPSSIPQISISSNQEIVSSPKIDVSQKEMSTPVSDGSSHTLFNIEELKQQAKKKFNFTGFVKEK